MLKAQRFLSQTFRLLSDVGVTEGEDEEFGVHITYQNLYHSILFLTCIYVGGLIASRFMKMPDLVGQIVVGILLGPNLADFVPNPEAWVLFGEIGLVLLVLDAGMVVDMDTLKLIGARGFIIAFFGSLFPTSFGIGLALAIGTDTKGAIAAGVSFGPTSLGIALNILRSGGILNTPVGQLIISAAIIDDMIALVVLSFLETLTTEITAKTIVVPIVSALSFLVIGGYIAINVAPGLIGRYILTRVEEKNHAKVELAIMIGLLLALMPATHYAHASYLMGSFLTGLVFCRSDGLHSLFDSQFKRIIQWLMRFFFAAAIGFQVPIKNFGDGTVIWQGLLFTLALTGKLGIGFMVPNFMQVKRFRGDHLRDCLVTGCAMASLGEFALVIAVFSVNAGLTSVTLYSSIVLAILISTIFPPFLLRTTIHYYRKKAERDIQEAAKEVASEDDDLLETITKQSTLFLCIQTQSKSRWGLMYDIMNAMYKLGLEVIDHRSWHPRGVNTTLVNEIYCKGSIDPALLTPGKADIVVAEHLTKFREELLNAINEPGVAKVKVERWYPGVVQKLIEESEQRVAGRKNDTELSFEDRLLSEATEELEKKHQFQLAATKQKSLQAEPGAGDVESQIATAGYITSATRPKPARQKMLSAPAGDSGHFFGADEPVNREEDAEAEFERFGRHHKSMTGKDKLFAHKSGPAGMQAELFVQGETFRLRIPQATLEQLRKGYSGESIDSHGLDVTGITMAQQDTPVVNMLQGYVRRDHPKSS